MEICFYNAVEDSLLKYAVMISKYQGKFVFCKHKERDTLEIPGGHREPGEDIETTARRELMEETGATKFQITPICVYRATDYGMLYFAEIEEYDSELHSEIEKVVLLDGLPEAWTYPAIQPKLMEEAKKRGFIL